MKKVSTIGIIAITFIWAGMICGISFLEAPLKFQAPGITLELGLGRDRKTRFWSIDQNRNGFLTTFNCIPQLEPIKNFNLEAFCATYFDCNH